MNQVLSIHHFSASAHQRINASTHQRFLTAFESLLDTGLHQQFLSANSPLQYTEYQFIMPPGASGCMSIGALMPGSAFGG